ncbi:PREDICTED: uncharacterized protein LOC106818934 [Priapulus caudatus]|uniref:Uncharacterized protein LOC106818934 n=1 Tax=Priapulus caudatus TaxID=37621 RepID=A0ABM1F3R7_PRICU|nr:PREDICTED: uncharacterized protein LOC106818934 [Priapulus caudatus]
MEVSEVARFEEVEECDWYDRMTKILDDQPHPTEVIGVVELTEEMMAEVVETLIRDPLFPGCDKQLLAKTSCESLLNEMAWINACLQGRKCLVSKSMENVWELYHKHLIENIRATKLPSQLFATFSRRAMQRLVASNQEVRRTPTSSRPLAITEEEGEIVAYIAGFVLHRLKQKAFRLSDSKEKTIKLDVINKLIRDEAVAITSRLILAKQRGGLLSAVPQLTPLFMKCEIMIRNNTSDDFVQHVDVQSMVDQACSDEAMTAIFFSVACKSIADYDAQEVIYVEIVATYIITRVNGFCRQTMERYRMRQNVKRRSNSLRKSLEVSSGSVSHPF